MYFFRIGKSQSQFTHASSEINDSLKRMARVEGTGGEMHISNDLSRILNLCDKIAQKRKDKYISSELFLLAAVEDSGPLGNMLRKAGAAKDTLEKR